MNLRAQTLGFSSIVGKIITQFGLSHERYY